MSLFRDLKKSGLQIMAGGAGERVEYWRGDLHETITAIPAAGERRAQPDETIRINGMRDWLIMVEELDFLKVDHRPGKPRKGDLLVFEGVTYEALPKDGDDAYSDKAMARYRVHTRVIKID